MINTIKEYSQKEKSSLKTVYLVLFRDNIFSVFQRTRDIFAILWNTKNRKLYKNGTCE